MKPSEGQTSVPAQVEAGKFYSWLEEEVQNKRKQKRLGQSFCNEFNITDPVLFYEEKFEKALEIIETKYVYFSALEPDWD